MSELGAIKAQTTITNGNLRKIIIALVLLFGIVMGTGFEPARMIVPLLIG